MDQALLLLPLPANAQTVGVSFPEYTPSPEPEWIGGLPGEPVTILRTGCNTGNAYSMVKASVPPGSGPLPHFHQNDDK